MGTVDDTARPCTALSPTILGHKAAKYTVFSSAGGPTASGMFTEPPASAMARRTSYLPFALTPFRFFRCYSPVHL